LKPVGAVDLEDWCLPCQEPHKEDKCPQKDEDYPDDINFIICNLNEEQTAQDLVDKTRRIGEREERIWALSKLTDDQRKDLKRREILVYKRKNASAPSSQPNAPLPPAKKVAPRPPLPVCELLPKPTPADDVQLNIDVANMFGKLNMTVPVTEMCNVMSRSQE
jgi:hypothetical protein